MPQLVALTEGTNIPLDKPIMLVGRHQECDIQIPSRKISRRHCCLAVISDHLAVRDLGSTNGIRINGIKVVEGNLQGDDELTIGNMRYQLKWSNESGQTVAAAKGAKKPRPTEESCEEPMPLPDLALSHPVLASTPPKPKTGDMEIPDQIELIPIDPPSQPSHS